MITLLYSPNININIFGSPKKQIVEMKLSFHKTLV